ncbi:hypothetical protein LSUE1_G006963 [Lachnellula suecica]|uniref:Low temperature requirement A n=1 Tax=Lachnellula suecica TaxID=602035 RepID=A0A8T9C216_9HELO|nr:hypothetical protein LSUE1_G006963 [Lachnellula suecica]
MATFAEKEEAVYSMPKLKLLASPLSNKGLENDYELTQRRGDRSDSKTLPQVENNSSFNSVERDTVCDLPSFQRHEEATNSTYNQDLSLPPPVELFFDLFFVANLTSFSSVHEINSTANLKSYIGFFCVLWFTWCQVSLFDVRFVADSVFERVAKACHLGVMVGFAVVGPHFNPEEPDKSVFQTMSLILMCSRLVLCLQYLVIAFHVRKWHKSRVPFALLAGINFVAAMIYLGITFVFTNEESNQGYIAFYIVAVAEIGGNIVVSSRWKAATFKGTHLVQRMSLLTLIILGEGVIVVCNNIGKIVKNSNSGAWDSETIGILVAAITIIYFLYMLYFDFLPKVHFGSYRQPIWAFFHAPFHLALVLFMEGLAEFVIWHKMVAAASYFSDQVSESLTPLADAVAANETANTAPEFFEQVVTNLNNTINAIWVLYPPEFTTTLVETENLLSEIGEGFIKGNETSQDAFEDTIDNLIYTVTHSIFETYGFESEETNKTLTGEQQIDADSEVIQLVFTYFYIAAGVSLLLMAVLHLITIRPFTFHGRLVRISSYFFFGLGICLLSAMTNFDAAGVLAVSPWVLPIVTIAVGLVLLLNHVRWPKRGSGHKGLM